MKGPNGINKWSHSSYVFSVLNREYVSLIIKQGECIYFDLFVGLKVQLMQYKGNDINNPVHSLLRMYYFILKNWLALKWIS